MTLELRVLGEFEARHSAGHLINVKAKKSRALLAALALAHSCSMSRESIAGLLWSDRGDTQARSSLRQALAGIRKDFASLDIPFLSIGEVKVSLDLAFVDVDAPTFRRLAASDDVAALRRAAALYRGELLADTTIRDPVFEQWLASERRRLADTASQVLEKLCLQETGAARIDAAKRLVALDPLREASHRLLMQVYSEAGEKTLALRQYGVCRDVLRHELGVMPEEETETLRQRLLQNSTEHARPAVPGNGVNLAARPGTMGGDKPSVAVLPLDVMGGDAELQDFCDGLTEDIITGLSRISAIRVIARNTMFTYKRRAIDIRTVGREVGARYVLEGSMRRAGTRIRVSAQLIEAASGHHIWAEQIDRVGAEGFDVQDDITRSVVASVQMQLILNEGRGSAPGSEPTERASRLLARSWQRFLGLTEASLADCRRLAERALVLESNAMGHRMLAVATYHQAYMGFIPWTESTIDELASHARMSIEFEDADEYCHWAMACAHLLKKQHERAAASLRRALELNPHCSLAHGSIGTVLAWGGQYDASIERNEFALRINPQDPTIFFRHFGLALAHYLASRYEKGCVHASVVGQTRPSWWLGRIIECASLAQLGRDKDAFHLMGELMHDRPDLKTASLDMLPFADSHDRQHLLEGLRKAGLPD